MNNEEKTLGQVARSSYDPYVIETAAWDHVAQAVITEHERRKAEQVKPEWKLPDPPAGAAWHRLDWTQDMLPDGYRPLLLGEKEDRKLDEYSCRDNSWLRYPASSLDGARPDDHHQRTTRPLPVKPDPFAIPDGYIELSSSEKDASWVEGGKWLSGDGWVDAKHCQGGCYASDIHRVIRPIPEPFAAEKAAFAAGKTIQHYSPDDSVGWMDTDTPKWFSGLQYRVKPEPAHVELGPDDVPIGSAISKNQGEGWALICSAGIDGIAIAVDGPDITTFEWSEIINYEINRNDGLGWVPCSKPKQD